MNESRRTGFLDGRLLRAMTFTIASLSVVVAVFACLLAIWEFTGTDVLWRTVATCIVVGSGRSHFPG